MQTILEILNKTTAYFQAKGIETAKLDAQLLLAEVLQCKRLELFLRFEEPISAAKLDAYRDFVRRRGRREPLQHIIGKCDFFGVPLKCDARALVPRPETEYLCELIAEKYLNADPAAPIAILDLGTGSGAIALALKNRLKNAAVLGVDASPDALELARQNAAANALDVEFAHSDWFAGVSGKFDLIVANPPYLGDAEVASAQPEVRDFDPISALRSGENGLADLRKILSAAPEFLKSGGLIACECGLGQPGLLKAEFGGKYAFFETAPDLSRRERYVFARV